MRKITLLLLLIVVSCQKQTTKKNEANDMYINAKKSIDYVGTYKGVLPCADCEGLEVEIAINENETFCIKTKYQGKGEKKYIQKGTFTWNKKGNIIILDDIKNAPNQYFVAKNTITQLDMSGNKIDGSLADEYILSKQPIDTSRIETVEENNAATVDLNSRMTATTVIQKVNPAVGKYTLAETKWKLVSLEKKKVSQVGKKAYYLKLNSKDGRFTAFTGCNTIAGNYAMPSSETLSFSEVIMTRMACPDITLESAFSVMLEEVTRYKLDKETLTLFGEGKKVLSKFEALK